MPQRYLFFAISSHRAKLHEPGSIIVDTYLATNLEKALNLVEDPTQSPVSTLNLASPYVLISGPDSWGMFSRDPLSLVMASGRRSGLLFKQHTLIWPGGQLGMTHHVFDISDTPYIVTGLKDNDDDDE